MLKQTEPEFKRTGKIYNYIEGNCNFIYLSIILMWNH